MLARSLTISPEGSGVNRKVPITDSSGVQLAECGIDGIVRDAGGTPLLAMKVDRGQRKDRPLDVRLHLLDASGGPIGTANVAKYKFTPRTKQLTVAVHDTAGTEVARIEPRDDKGESLTVVTDGTEVGSMSRTQVKKGFLKRVQVYGVELTGDVPAEREPLVLGAIIGFDALYDGVVAASMRD